MTVATSGYLYRTGTVRGLISCFNLSALATVKSLRALLLDYPPDQFLVLLSSSLLVCHRALLDSIDGQLICRRLALVGRESTEESS
jgi:hypothetical protein